MSADFSTIGTEGEISDAAISALARLLLAVAEDEPHDHENDNGHQTGQAGGRCQNSGDQQWIISKNAPAG